MRRTLIATVASCTVIVAGLAVGVSPSAAVTGTIQVSVNAGALTATASPGLAPFGDAHALQISTMSSGTVRIQTWNEVEDTPGPAILWSADPNCIATGVVAPVSVITCNSTKASVNLAAASVKTLTVVTDATPLVFAGGSGPDEVYSGAGADELNGGDGDDDLFGGRGNDAIDGGAGNDNIEGEQGNDAMRAGTGDDNIISAEDVPEKDDLVECGTATGRDTLDLDPLLDITRNCQGVGDAAAPANVKATGTISANNNAIVNATWAAAPGAAAYQIDYSTDSGATWVSLTRVASPSLGGWNAGSLRGNVILRVSAVKSDAVSSGVLSNRVTLGVPPPANVRATGWADEESLDTGFQLRWEATQSPEYYEVQYRLCASGGACSAWTTAIVVGTARLASYTVTSPGSYEVRMRAYSPSGATSNWVSTLVSVPTGPVRAVTGVNAWASEDAFLALWVSSSLATKWLKGYRIQRQIDKPGGAAGQWEDVHETSGTRTAIRLTSKSLGTKPDDFVRFRVITVPVYGADSAPSAPSPWRQQTSAVPGPTNFAATYDAATDLLTVTWRNPAISTTGGVNVGGYDFAYQLPGSRTWTQPGLPLRYDAERAVFSLENVPRGPLNVRIRSIGWPDNLYSAWTVARAVRK